MKIKSIAYNELNNLCWEEDNLQQGFSDIGNGGLIDITNHVEELGHPFEELKTMQEEGISETFYQCIGLGVTKQLPDLYNTVELFSNTQVNPDEPSFYYTTDHLGSSSYITNDLGQTTQIIAYMPYGEDWVNRNFTQNFRSNYKYNGKEKDPESGYYNYGARYYYDWASIWLSVDPMSDKYPHLTSYNYCANNPIMLVDPDGREIYITGNDAQRDHVKNEINKRFEGRFKVDIDSRGKLTYKTEEGAKNFTQLEQAFMTAADDTKVISQLNVTEENSYDGFGFVGGGCLGSEKMGDQILSQQAYNPTHAKIIEEHGGPKVNSIIVHEILEGFFMGEDSPGKRPSSNETQHNEYINAYDYNHGRAVTIDPKLILEYNGMKPGQLKGTAIINGETINVYEKAKNRNRKQ
ncbi:MAG: RHS repeat-associated core domain-containing protein [Bacteroidales bacterium]